MGRNIHPAQPFMVVIPARYASTRLPGKPLLDIAGKPMIQRVVEQAMQSRAARVVVATDEARIADIAHALGVTACMTRADHSSGTDRLQEVAQQLGWTDDTIVVNVQGDEPLIPPTVINQVATNLAQQAQASIATLCERIDEVKVVFDQQGLALYFSRAPIPWPRDAFRENQSALPAGFAAYRHIGIYAYRAAFLHRFINWPPAALEQTESLEQLRALANGVHIHVQEACARVPGGVDTEADLQQLRSLLSTHR